MHSASVLEYWASRMGQVAPGATGQVLSVDEAIALSADFVHTHLPDALCAFIAGSAATGLMRPYSDVDLHVVSPQPTGPSVRHLVHKGAMIELHIHALHELAANLALSAMQGYPVNAIALAGGIRVDLSHPEVAEKLVGHARAQLSKGALPLNEATVETLRVTITNQLLDISFGLPHGELLGCGAKLMEQLLFVALRQRGEWFSPGRHALRILAAHDPVMASAFETAFRLLFGAGECQAVMALAEQVLAPVGGFAWAGYQYSPDGGESSLPIKRGQYLDED